MFFWKRKNKQEKDEDKTDKKDPIPHSIDNLEKNIKNNLQNAYDLVIHYEEIHKQKVVLFYLSSLANSNMINQNVINPIQSLRKEEPKKLKAIDIEQAVSVGESKLSDDLRNIVYSIVQGWCFIYVKGDKEGILFDVKEIKERSIAKSEIETNVYGPQVAFNESCITNIALIRQFIQNPMLTVEQLKIGKVSQTTVGLLYINGIANDQNVQTMKQRLNDAEFDGIVDTSIIGQLITDNTWSIFPQIRLTERPDYVGFSLIEGKIAVLVDGSPYAIIAPATINTFLQTTEDYYLPWNMATFLRLLRFFGVFLSVFFTATYVAALTFHYEIIPEAILLPLGQTRVKVPFPPLIEALFLEFTIELLREAGARLPTKVGQTIGIVGGIVIGQAAVEAGFTSNILIIIVALSALSSFAVPSYKMGTAIRIIRFPMIILAGIWGGLGIVLGITFILVHLLRLTSLGSPYIQPFYPLRLSDMKDTIVSFPYSHLTRRPIFTRPEDKNRFNKRRAKKVNDIDE